MGTSILIAVAVLAGPVSFPKTALKPAIKEAQRTHKLILVEFWTFNTEPSRSYSEKVLGTPTVLNWLAAHALGARVNFDFNASLCKRFFVKEVPTLLLLDEKLRVWARITGSRRPAEIVRELDRALKERAAFRRALKVLKENPKDGAALLDLYRGYLRQENAKQAEAALLKLKDVDPEGKLLPPAEGAFDIAARILEPRRQTNQAIRLFTRAAEWARKRNPEVRRDALFRLANLKLLEGEPDTAAKLLELLLSEFKRFPDRSKALYVLGLIYVRDLKETKKGKKVLIEVRDRYADRFSLAAERLLDLVARREKGEIE